MESLPSDITYKILSHIPPESVLNCKLVCKTWRTLLSQFKVKVGLLFAISHDWNDQVNSGQLLYGYYNDIAESHQLSFTKLPKINLPPIQMLKYNAPPVVVGSCNGLVCFSLPQPRQIDHINKFYYPINDPVYICNPFTGEYVNLPKVSGEVGHIGSGFGYLSKTNEYKVVRIHYPGKFRGDHGSYLFRGRVQVYTLGSGGGGGGWRNIGKTTHDMWSPGVAGDGVIHFMEGDGWEQKLVTFDLADEEFRVVPQPPPCLGSRTSNSFYEVKVLGGHLHVVHAEGREHVALWSFKRRNIINDNHWDMEWSKEFSIPWNSGVSGFHPISLTRSNQVLFSFSGDSYRLFCYDPKTDSVETIASEDGNLRCLQTVLHMNSMVSIKDLGVQSNFCNASSSLRMEN